MHRSIISFPPLRLQVLHLPRSLMICCTPTSITTFGRILSHNCALKTPFITAYMRQFFLFIAPHQPSLSFCYPTSGLVTSSQRTPDYVPRGRTPKIPSFDHSRLHCDAIHVFSDVPFPYDGSNFLYPGGRFICSYGRSMGIHRGQSVYQNNKARLFFLL